MKQQHPLKIYLASRYGRREEMEKYANMLKEKGFEITSTWNFGGENGLSNEDIANLDLDDVLRADVVLSFTDPYGSVNKGGARFTEFGVGYVLGKHSLIVGEREIVFHHLPKVEQFDNLDDAVDYLEELRNDRTKIN